MTGSDQPSSNIAVFAESKLDGELPTPQACLTILNSYHDYIPDTIRRDKKFRAAMFVLSRIVDDYEHLQKALRFLKRLLEKA